MNQTFHICVEGDVVVPDLKPDVQEVLLTKAYAVAESQEYKNGRLTVSGTVFFRILYCPEEETTPKAMEASFPFSEGFDLSLESPCAISVSAVTEHIGFALVNSRKLSMKVIVALLCNGSTEREFAPVTAVCAAEEIPCCKKTYHVSVPCNAASETFTVSDFLTVPQELPDIGELLMVEANALCDNSKVMNGKVMVKGTVYVHSFYASPEGKVTDAKHQIPFTEVVEAADITEDCNVFVGLQTGNVSSSVRGDLNGDTKIISVDVAVTACVEGEKTVVAEMIEDCYATNGGLQLEKEQVRLPETVLRETVCVPCTQSVSVPNHVALNDVVFSDGKVLVRDVTASGDKVTVNGTFVSFLLYTDEKGNVKSAVTESDFQWEKPVKGMRFVPKCQVWMQGLEVQKNGKNQIDVKADIGLFVQVKNICDSEIVTACESVETHDSAANPSASLVIYFTKEGDTLWDIAKRYRSTKAKIAQVNGFDENVGSLEQGRKIVVPRM